MVMMMAYRFPAESKEDFRGLTPMEAVERHEFTGYRFCVTCLENMGSAGGDPEKREALQDAIRWHLIKKGQRSNDPATSWD
jgi:hypothetical protein